MPGSFSIVSRLVLAMLLVAGCTIEPQLTSPPAHTESVPATPSIPTVLSPTFTIVPTNTFDEQQKMNKRLIQAAEVGDTATVFELLKAGADINVLDDQGRTPVMVATHGNHVDTVQALIEAGADINIQDNRLDNPFLYAGAEGFLEIVKLTIAAGADTRLTNRFGGTALIPAAERGHVEIVNELLTFTDVDINHVNDLGWTALLEAVILSDGGGRHQQIVQVLVDHGADVHIPDKNGITSLQHAQARGFNEIERILLEANVNPRDVDTELILAAQQRESKAVKELLGKGANVHLQDNQGRSALIIAAYNNDPRNC